MTSCSVGIPFTTSLRFVTRTSALSLHVIDCLAAVPSLRRQLALLKGRCLVDVGSGGGLPGVIFAITDRSMRVTCVDSVGKKAAFVTQVAGELGLPNLTSVHRRVEELNGPFSVIASRAFSSLQNFARVTGHCCRRGRVDGDEGKVPSEEIADIGAKNLGVSRGTSDRPRLVRRSLLSLDAAVRCDQSA
jgi:16S rRNA (guanine527-N7)-methyltransferase